MLVTDNPHEGRWFLGDVPSPPPVELRARVRTLAREIAEDLDLTVDEFMFRKYPECVEARSRLCVIASELLSPYMSSVDIAAFLGVPRTSFVYRIRTWKAKYAEHGGCT